MFYYYGSYLPCRWLDELKTWKEAEVQTVSTIRQQLPLPLSADRLLADWSAVFDGTARCADYWRRAWAAAPTDQTSRATLAPQTAPYPALAGLPPSAEPHVIALLQAARAQSESFARHLDDLADGCRHDRRDEPAAVLAQAAAASRGYAARMAQLVSGDRPWRKQAPEQAAEQAAHAAEQTPEQAAGQRVSQPGVPDPRESLPTAATDPDNRIQATWSDPLQPSEGGPSQPPSLGAVPIGGHTLPPLPYAYNALEPYIDEETMRLHHDKHHQSYVDGLNKAELALQAARAADDFGLVKHWERELAFHGAGHYLHTLFWKAMSPRGGGEPEGRLREAIDRSFGSFEAFKRQFTAAAEAVEGGGWAILVYSPRSRRLEILQAEKHQNLSQWDAVPLLPLDVWEHAYYLKYRNKRADYVANWWNVVNWPYVAERYDAASRLQWEPRSDQSQSDGPNSDQPAN